MLKKMSSVGLIDLGIIMFSTVTLGSAVLAKWWPTTVLVSLTFFVIGQWVIVVQHAMQERRRERAWLLGVEPVLRAVQISVNRHIVSVARSPRLDKVNMSNEHSPTWMSREGYRKTTKWVLDKVKSEDFLPSSQERNEPHPYEERLVKLRDNIVVPMRDLVRWGLTMERVYSAKNRERYSSRTMLMALLEMVLTHYLADIEAMLETVHEWPQTMPEAVWPTGVEFVPFKWEAERLLLVSGDYEIPQSAERIARALNALGNSLKRLKLTDKIYELPVSSKFQRGARVDTDSEGRFCQDYLLLIWYRTIVVLLGEQLVAM